MFKTGPLRHCGIMVNYACTAACRHCLYACSPTRTGGYMTKETAEAVSRTLAAGGCRSVHIGGGEPFLDFEGLARVIETVTGHDIVVDYIETNAFWASSGDAELMLKRLLALGIDALCISVDPFHAEYVPPELPLQLAALCDKTGMGYFLWKQQFLRPLSRLGPAKAHSRSVLEDALGQDYIIKTAREYGIGYGGRAVNIDREYSKKLPAEQVINSKPCTQLLATGHFHVDYLGRFIPPGCTGFVIPLDEAYRGIEDGRYPVFELLYTGGTAALLPHALERGFIPDPEGYTSSCNLCFFLRRWLSQRCSTPELDPEHYEASMEYY